MIIINNNLALVLPMIDDDLIKLAKKLLGNYQDKLNQFKEFYHLNLDIIVSEPQSKQRFLNILDEYLERIQKTG